MTTHQTIKDLVNQKFDPISQKINNIQQIIYIGKFPEDTLNIMKHLIDFTDMYKKETGGILCLDDDNIITLENTCIGDSCSLKIQNYECSNNKKLVGNYHTHFIGDKISPGTNDLLLMDATIIDIICIGQTIKGTKKITCFSLKHKDFDIERSENLAKLRLQRRKFILEIFGIGYDKWRKVLDEHIDKYYNKFEIIG